MPRIARLTVPGSLHHVISRFVDREWFFATDNERSQYLLLLGLALARSDWRCLAYCLMSNHIHLAMVAGKMSLDSWARKVNSPFANWLNQQHGRLGPVFADRPAAYVVPGEREADVIAYIHNNPVRAGVAATARMSTWSSHQAYVGVSSPPDWLNVDEGLSRAGCSEAPLRFDALVNGQVDSTLDLPDLEQARHEARRLGPFEIGTPILTTPSEVPIVVPHFVRQPPSATELVDAVVAATGLATNATARRHARGNVAVAKRVIIHAAVRLGISISEVSAAMSISRQRGAKVAQTPLSLEENELLRGVMSTLATQPRKVDES
ncbi:MAG TPA: transposase [Kofleriaceae bacterium]|nr:transposase [Kofleriaceae bacterium]